MSLPKVSGRCSVGLKTWMGKGISRVGGDRQPDMGLALSPVPSFSFLTASENPHSECAFFGFFFATGDGDQ